MVLLGKGGEGSGARLLRVAFRSGLYFLWLDFWYRRTNLTVQFFDVHLIFTILTMFFFYEATAPRYEFVTRNYKLRHYIISIVVQFAQFLLWFSESNIGYFHQTRWGPFIFACICALFGYINLKYEAVYGDPTWGQILREKAHSLVLSIIFLLCISLIAVFPIIHEQTVMISMIFCGIGIILLLWNDFRKISGVWTKIVILFELVVLFIWLFVSLDTFTYEVRRESFHIYGVGEIYMQLLSVTAFIFYLHIYFTRFINLKVTQERRTSIILPLAIDIGEQKRNIRKDRELLHSKEVVMLCENCGSPVELEGVDTSEQMYIFCVSCGVKIPKYKIQEISSDELIKNHQDLLHRIEANK